MVDAVVREIVIELRNEGGMHHDRLSCIVPRTRPWALKAAPMTFLYRIRSSRCKDKAVTIVGGLLSAISKQGPPMDPPPAQVARFFVETAWHSMPAQFSPGQPIPNHNALAALAISLGLQGSSDANDTASRQIFITCMSCIIEILKAETLTPQDRQVVANAFDRFKACCAQDTPP